MSEESSNIEQTTQAKPHQPVRFAGSYVLIKNIPFVFFLGFLAVIYIANAHLAERKVRQIQVVQKELKQNRWKYMSIKSQLMSECRQDIVANTVKPLGLFELKRKPKKIVAKRNY